MQPLTFVHAQTLAFVSKVWIQNSCMVNNEGIVETHANFFFTPQRGCRAQRGVIPVVVNNDVHIENVMYLQRAYVCAYTINNGA